MATDNPEENIVEEIINQITFYPFVFVVHREAPNTRFNYKSHIVGLFIIEY